MGFFSGCWEALLQFASYAQVTGLLDHAGQRPLMLPHNDHTQAVAGPVFAPQGAEANFVCNYTAMAGYKACNSASDRQCWLKPSSSKNTTFNIHTNYEDFHPVGVRREYWLNTSVQAIAPDGYLKPLAQLFNATYPGPNLQACWGDEVIVHVTNFIPNLGTTVHWHGIRQFQSNQYDGVNGVTQCPIANGNTFTYTFRADQIGHTWYHSHYQTQYSDGMMAPLTIYGPTSANYDETDTPIIMNDWVHENTSVAFRQELGGGVPLADSLLLGGHGIYKCSDLDSSCCSGCRTCAAGVDEDFCCTPNPLCNPGGKQLIGSSYTKTFVKGKRYLMKLINGSAGAMFIFSIDGHDLEVVQTDLVPIVPFKTDSLFIGIGQRYQIIVTAKPKTPSADGNYWIRTRIAQGCGNVAQDDETTGIVTYNSKSATPQTNANNGRNLCIDESPANLKPVVPWNVTNLQGDRDNFTFTADLDTAATHGAFRWDLTDTPLFLDYGNPAILNTENNTYINDPFNAMWKYNFSTGYVYLIVDGSNLPNETATKTQIAAAHPIHLHGHDFVILAQQDSPFNGTDFPPFNFDNPTRRDVALLYGGGYLALAFKPDNPGIWLVHCHIAWHASSGLALQIIERQDEIVPWLGALPDVRAGCEGWHDMNLQFAQDDSGI